jgi:hypothetical protein
MFQRLAKLDPTLLLTLSAACIGLTACSSEAPTRAETVMRGQDGSHAVISISSSLNNAITHLPAESLAPDLVLGGDSASSFSAIGDVATFPDGRIAVLDLGSKSIRMFNSDGRSLGTLGHAGEGPNEFSRPVAIAVLDSDLIVLQASRTRALLRVGLNGRVLNAIDPPDQWRLA